jgi:hypothetical protein
LRVARHARRGALVQTIPAVLEDIRALPEACFYFADENLLFHDPVNRRYTLSMLEQLGAQRPRKLFFPGRLPVHGDAADGAVRAPAAPGRMRPNFILCSVCGVR